MNCLILFLSIFVVAEERTFEQTFDVKPGSEFELETHKGSINIRTHDGDQVIVRARIYHEKGQDGTPVEVEIRARKLGNDVVVSVEEMDTDDGGSGISGIFRSRNRVYPMIEFNIQLPDYCDLRIEDHKSSYDVEAPAGKVRIDTHKGQGRIDGIRSKFNLDSHKGRFDIGIEQLTSVHIDTHKGRIDMVVKGATDLQIRADTHKGDLNFSGRKVTKQEEDHGYQVYYDEGSGDQSIRLDTHKGTINVEFVD